MDIYEKALKFIRAKQIMTMQIRGNELPTPVHIPSNEFDTVIPNRRQVVDHLINTGQLKKTVRPSRNGHEMFEYDAGPGPYDLRLLVKPNQQLTPLELTMRSYLLKTGLQPDAESTMYFNVFLKHKEQVPELFFKVDKFARRVHTPVCNFHRAYRPYLTIEGDTVASLDVTTMQPLILGKVLGNVLPGNDFSRWINEGEDIYVKLQTASGLETRDEGKKRFFEIAFSPPSDALAKAFGNCEWVEWVNWYKGQNEPGNCHNKDKPHSNLAWLLQTTEVNIMRKVWGELAVKKIPFLSVHDEVIIKAKDEPAAAAIMHNVLSSEFVYYKLNSKQPTTLQAAAPKSDLQAEKKEQPAADPVPDPSGQPEFTYTIKKEPAADPPPPVAIGPHGYPAGWDEPPTGVDMAAIVAQFTNTGQFKPGKVGTPTKADGDRIKPIDRKKQRYQPTWDIEAIREQLAAITIPAGPVELGAGFTIVKPQFFIDTGLQMIEANNGNPTYKIEYERLLQFVEICNGNENNI